MTASASSRRRGLLALGVVVIGVLVGAWVLATPRAPARPYDPDSSGPAGLLALRLWLEEQDYAVARLERRPSAAGSPLPALGEVDLLLVFPTALDYSAAEAAALETWVARGNTLVLVGMANAQSELHDLTEVTASPPRSTGLLASLDDLRQSVPLLPDAPAHLGRLEGRWGLDISRAPEVVGAVRTHDGVVTAAAELHGAGTIWYLSERHDLTNARLSGTQDGYLLPAILRTVPAGGRAAVDSHLSDEAPGTVGPRSLSDWLTQSSAGRAVLLAGAVLFTFWAFAGARLGPPLARSRAERRREAAEHVVAMAGLYLRSSRHAEVAEHHRRRLKSQLGRAHAISPDLSDERFLLQLEASPSAPGRELIARIRAALSGLGHDPNEDELVRLAAEVDDLLAAAPGVSSRRDRYRDARYRHS